MLVKSSLLLFNLDRELASFSLVVPLLDPVDRTQRGEGFPEDLAWLKVFAFNCDTFVVVDVTLGTVLGLVCVRESWVELRSVELEVFCVQSHGELRRCFFGGGERKRYYNNFLIASYDFPTPVRNGSIRLAGCACVQGMPSSVSGAIVRKQNAKHTTKRTIDNSTIAQDAKPE